MDTIRIVDFHPDYAKRFKELNVAWLQKYFYVEPKDEWLLENCKESIINKGGYILFAKLKDEIIGCLSYIPNENGDFELGKMAIDEAYHGKKIGQKLLVYALEFAKTKGWKKITLYSSTKLPNALHIYRKFGFVEIPLEADLPYARSDIKMELIF